MRSVMEMRMLLADADKDGRKELEGLLASECHDVAVVGSGEAALEHFRKKGADIALLDWGLPDIDGREVTELVRSLEEGGRERSYIILLVTPETETDDIIDAFGKGADDYLSKPFSDVLLFSRLAVAKDVLEARGTVTDTGYDPLKALREEHDVILREGAVLEALSNAMNITPPDEGRLPRHILDWAMRSPLLTWDIHHAKEEYYLDKFVSKVTEEHGKDSHIFPRSSLKQVRTDHRKVRTLLLDLVGAFDRYRGGDAGCIGLISDLVFSYTTLMRAHNAREDGVFFPLSEKYLTEGDMVGIVEQFMAIEEGSDFKEYLDWVERLADIEKEVELDG